MDEVFIRELLITGAAVLALSLMVAVVIFDMARVPKNLHASTTDLTGTEL